MARENCFDATKAGAIALLAAGAGVIAMLANIATEKNALLSRFIPLLVIMTIVVVAAAWKLFRR